MKTVNIDNDIVEKIVNTVCEYYRITPKETFTNSRKYKIKMTRQIIQYFCKKYTKKGLSDIGYISVKYGRGKAHDHATILNSCKTIKNLTETDRDFNLEILDLDNIISHSLNINNELDIDKSNKEFIKKYYESLLLDKDTEISRLNFHIQNLKA